MYESRHHVGSIHARYVVHFNILKNASFIFLLPLCPAPRAFIGESGCKGKAYFSTSKFYQVFFQTFFWGSPETCLYSISFKLFFQLALSLESGCKDKAIDSPFPNIFKVIFKVFYKPLDNNTLKKPCPGMIQGIHGVVPVKFRYKLVSKSFQSPFKDARERL